MALVLMFLAGVALGVVLGVTAIVFLLGQEPERSMQDT
jgi:hypothetical protein